MTTELVFSHGRGLNGHGGVAEAVLTEHRITKLEAGQQDHSRRLRALEASRARQERHRPPSPPGRDSSPQNSPVISKLWMALLSQAVKSASQWIGGILALAYVLKGGDILTALQALAKLL